MPDPTPPKLSKPAAPANPAAPPAAKGGNAAAPSAPAAPATPAKLELPPESKYQWLAGLREITTTVLAVAIVTVTLVILWCTFEGAGTFENKKDVLLYVLPILGTVIGYYFGRVPAERRAEVSEKQAGKAQDTAQAATAQSVQTQAQTDQKLNQVKVGVERAKAKMEAAGAGAQGAGAVLAGGTAPSVAGAPGPAGAPRHAGTGASEAWHELDAVSKLL